MLHQDQIDCRSAWVGRGSSSSRKCSMYFPVGWPKQLNAAQPTGDLRPLVHISSNQDRLLFAVLTHSSISVWYCKVSNRLTPLQFSVEDSDIYLLWHLMVNSLAIWFINLPVVVSACCADCVFPKVWQLRGGVWYECVCKMEAWFQHDSHYSKYLKSMMGSILILVEGFCCVGVYDRIKKPTGIKDQLA